MMLLMMFPFLFPPDLSPVGCEIGTELAAMFLPLAGAAYLPASTDPDTARTTSQ